MWQRQRCSVGLRRIVVETRGFFAELTKLPQVPAKNAWPSPENSWGPYSLDTIWGSGYSIRLHWSHFRDSLACPELMNNCAAKTGC